MSLLDMKVTLEVRYKMKNVAPVMQKLSFIEIDPSSRGPLTDIFHTTIT